MDPDVEFCLHGVARLVQDGDMNASAVVVLVIELLDGTVDANAYSRLIGVELLHESADRVIGDGVAHEVESMSCVARRLSPETCCITMPPLKVTLSAKTDDATTTRNVSWHDLVDAAS